ncbi:ATP-grasp domain-containing protein [Pseudobacteriovorax antillogorgiicola]|uniref:ATP-grasp domain-containing protein n=1 Tax=Pseudobacteriovorax antillogorgiicola TaxID=1513793 RepID=A0A1Y6CE39_9BACT|nr:ATP-grasp domain-containing protein [Pseudobacteriovorax antillogorgiicola]TCS47940.1 ATP-grasp domain-containing protein [Pseudobacteriovorax antillogorgiicola]SMF58059.1 ATP-grasp domain-containing protein [Pseudobacteriovorax antillogorgiicola]
MTRRGRYFLIQDPYHPYAYEFIKRINKKDPDLRPLAFYSNPRLKFYFRKSYNLKKSFSNAVEYDVPPGAIDQFLQYGQDKYEIVGILPWNEQVLDLSVYILKELNLPWNEPKTISLFRDKYRFKDMLYRSNKALLPSPSRCLQSYNDYLKVKDEVADRFVIKPNNGYSNQCIGFFDKSTPDKVIESYFQSSSKYSDFTLEDFLEGEEFAINGQVDEKGDVHILSIFQYQRVLANGRSNVYAETWNLPDKDPRFALLVEYAKQVMTTSKLVRCPFHMEIIDDVQLGPTLVEVGCRTGGGMLITATNDVHDNRLDAFDIAAHFYLFDTPYGKIDFNWDYGNEVSFLDLDGISPASGYIYRLRNKQATEKRAEFVRWTSEPQIGQRVYKTVDLETLPWAMHLKSKEGKEHLKRVAESIRREFIINEPQNAVLKWMTITRVYIKKLFEKVLWWGHRSFQKRSPF